MAKLGLIAWLPEQDEILRKYYPLEDEAAFKKLPDKTVNACKKRAKKLGVVLWSSKEDEILRKYYPEEG